MKKRNTKKKRKQDEGILSIPNVLLADAGIKQGEDLVIETIPGVILVGKEQPLYTANEPLLALFTAMGITPEEVIQAMEEGGMMYE